MPKLTAFRTYPFTADVWNFRRSTDPTGGEVRTYFRLRSVKCSVTQGMFGKVTVSFPDDSGDIMDQAQLRNLTDRKGNELYLNGVWTLQGLVPMITPFGTREGYRADAKLEFVDG